MSFAVTGKGLVWKFPTAFHSGELVNDDSKEVKEKMLEKMPSLKGMYSADDDNMQMLYFKDAVATFCSFTEAPEQINF